MFQDSSGWAIAVMHNPATPAHTAFHTAFQWNQIPPAIFSSTISTQSSLPSDLLSRKPSTEALELEGNLSAVFYSTPLQSSLFTHSKSRPDLTDEYLQWWWHHHLTQQIVPRSSVGLGFFAVMQSQKHACTKTRVQATFLLLQPGHCFHHILLKHKMKINADNLFSSWRAAFSKICKLVGFGFNAGDVYQKHLNNKPFLC